MSEALDRARELLDKANTVSATTADVGVGYLIWAIEAVIQELEAHQHTYAGPPPGLPHQWMRTGADRDVDAAGTEAYRKQQQAKAAEKERRNG